MPFILALDQSTSATKALLFDETGRALDRESREHGQFYPQPGWVEHDPEEIWLNTLSVLRAIIARHREKIAAIVGLSITNQRETVVVFDRASGRPLAPAIVWQCRRGDAICAEHASAGFEPLVHARTGLKLDAYFSASKLQWLIRHDSALRARLADGSALIGTIDTYLVYRLTLGRVFATDTTNASRTLLFDITRLQWDEELCALWSVPRAALPEVRDSTARFGETTIDGALALPVSICGVMGDSQASLFAQRGFEPGAAKATFGTGTSILLNIGTSPRVGLGGVLTALAWSHRGVPTYAFEGLIISSASTLTWLRDRLGFVGEVAEFEALARATVGNDGVYLVPAFSGLGLPHWRSDARAALVGLSSHSHRGHVARAALESIAYQIRDALETLRTAAGVSLRVLHADGGPTANTLLMQFTADVTGAEIRVASMSDGSALGAALAGLLGLGTYQSLGELGALPRLETVYLPTTDSHQMQLLYAGWQRAVRQTLSELAPSSPPVTP